MDVKQMFTGANQLLGAMFQFVKKETGEKGLPVFQLQWIPYIEFIVFIIDRSFDGRHILERAFYGILARPIRFFYIKYV